jgi:hypothetical protein
MQRLKEIAKFASGAEAFHALVHTYLWLSGTTLTVLGITATPTLNLMGAIVNAAISLLLGVYAWGNRRTAQV